MVAYGVAAGGAAVAQGVAGGDAASMLLSAAGGGLALWVGWQLLKRSDARERELAEGLRDEVESVRAELAAALASERARHEQTRLRLEECLKGGNT